MHKDLNTLSEQNKNIFEQKAVLYKYCASIIDSGLKEKYEQKNYHLLSQISQYIQENIKNYLSLKKMCADLGYSYHYNSGIFKKNFGMIFLHMSIKSDLMKLVKLLKYTKKTSCEIANECGFSTIRIFNITFKNHFGITSG